MDPVTAIGLAASLINIMDAVMKVIVVMNDIKGATKEQAAMVQEVTSLLPFLSSLKTRAEVSNETDPWFARAIMLAAPNGAIALLSNAITELSLQLDRLYGRNKVSRSLGWVLKKEECNAILVRIERSKSLIIAELQRDSLLVLSSDVCYIVQLTLSSNLSLSIKEDTGQIPTLGKGIEEIRIGQHESRSRDDCE